MLGDRYVPLNLSSSLVNPIHMCCAVDNEARRQEARRWLPWMEPWHW